MTSEHDVAGYEWWLVSEITVSPPSVTVIARCPYEDDADRIARALALIDEMDERLERDAAERRLAAFIEAGHYFTKRLAEQVEGMQA